MNIRQLLGPAALFLGFLSMETDAAAGNVFVGGIQCTQTSGGTLAYYEGTIYNSSTSSTLNVQCPITSTTGMRVDFGAIKVFDRSTTAAVTCTVIEVAISGATVTTYTQQQSTPSGFYGSDVQTLSYSTMTSGGFDYFYVTCSVPPVDAGVSHVGGIYLFTG
jgi:hypothetical protein